MGGLSHSKISAINRNNILFGENINNNFCTNYSDLSLIVNKLVYNTTQSSPLQDLLINL